MSTIDAYIKKITELLRECDDPDLLDLVYKLLLQETGNQAADVF